MMDGGQVVEAAGRFVVDNDNVISASQQALGQMRANKTRAAGDKDACHNKSRLRANRGSPAFCLKTRQLAIAGVRIWRVVRRSAFLYRFGAGL